MSLTYIYIKITIKILKNLTLLVIIFCSIVFKLSAQPTDSKAESTSVYSSTGWGFTLSDLQSTMKSWGKNSNVIIDTIGLSVDNRPLYRVSIMKDGKVSNQPYRIAIHARTHPAEVQTSYVTNEIIQILLSNNVLAKQLLDSCIFNIVPMYNPDGVELGLARTNFNGVDIEGDWSSANPEKEVATLRALYKTYMDSKIPIRVALNIHSALACERYFVFHAETGTSYNYTQEEKRFITAIRNYWPEGIQNWDYNITWTSGTPAVFPESWFWNNYNEKVMALTYEDMNCVSAGEYDKTSNSILSGISDYLKLSSFNSVRDINFAKQNDLEIYPNPVLSGQNIIIKYMNKSEEIAALSLIDLNGREVYQKSLIFNSVHTSKMLIPMGLKGLFILQLQSKNKRVISKLIIE